MERITTQRSHLNNGKLLGIVPLVALLAPARSIAENLTISPSGSGKSVAFARYLASIREGNPFPPPGPLAIQIDAALPGSYKQSRLTAIRRDNGSDRAEYHIEQMEGDAIVMQEVVVAYLDIANKIEELPCSSIAITPSNYKFQYLGEVGNAGALAYVFQITPRKKRDGLLQGQLWIDAATGREVLQTGRLLNPHSERIDVVRDTKLVNGSPCARVTHVTIETRHAGRGELIITELPLTFFGGANDDLLNRPGGPVVDITSR
jgi:hypothetical protein